MRIAIVVARFNEFVTERLLTGAQELLREHGIADTDVELLRVPGAFRFRWPPSDAETGRVSAVICLGCLIRGAPALQPSRRRARTASRPPLRRQGVPMAFGVLTTNSVERSA
jgi:6,7-dimethyl-8-ribityllumazine synthase